MFKFGEYPRIADARKERIRLKNLAFKAEIKAQRSKKAKYDKLWDEAIETELRFVRSEYARAVFETFAPLKPDITADKIGATYTWDEMYGDDFSVLSDNMKRSLPMLVEDETPYRLPDGYYYDGQTEAEIRRRENEKSDRIDKILKGVKWTLVILAAAAVGAFAVYLFET